MRWPEDYKIQVNQKVLSTIAQFYKNMGRKHVNSYGYEEIDKLIMSNIHKIRYINHTKQLSDPLLDRWKGLYRVVVGKWNFALKINDKLVTIVDASHAQNMSDKNRAEENEELEEDETPRITEIKFPHIPGSSYFIRCKIDGEQQFSKQMNKEDYLAVKFDLINPLELAEKYYSEELNAMQLDKFLGPKY